MVTQQWSEDFDGDGVVYEFFLADAGGRNNDLNVRARYGQGEVTLSMSGEDAHDFHALLTQAMHAQVWASVWQQD